MRTAPVLGLLAALLVASFDSKLHRRSAVTSASEKLAVSFREPTTDKNRVDALSSKNAGAQVTGQVRTEHYSDEALGASNAIESGDANAHFVATLNVLSRDTNSTASDLRQSMLRHWAEEDPAAAAAWSTRLAGPCYREALQQVAIAWGNVDLSAAANWIATLPDNGAKRSAAICLGYEAVRTDPLAALEIATGIDATPQRDELMAQAVSQWAASDSDRALNWARQISDPELRERLVAAIAVAVAKEDGATAASMVATVLAPGDAQSRAAFSVAQRWVQVSPQSTAAWVRQFPDDSLWAAISKEINPALDHSR
jgi:hypothetical protein